MLEVIFGNKTAQLIFLRLFTDGHVSAGALARDYDKAVFSFQNQLERFEDGGLLVSKKIGSVRLFSFNPQSSYVNPLKELIRVEFEKIKKEDYSAFFPERMRPRKRGKEILSDS